MRVSQTESSDHSFGVDLLHDFGGAILFSVPLLMTMEMWWLGFYGSAMKAAQRPQG